MQKYDMEKLFEKTGGPFRLTVLVQKRLIELKKGSRKLVDSDCHNLMDIVYQEILADKIRLVTVADIEMEILMAFGKESAGDLFESDDSDDSDLSILD